MEKASKAAALKRQADAKAKIEADSTALFYSALKGQAQKVVLRNEKVELTLNTKGGTVEKAVHQGLCGSRPQGERRLCRPEGRNSLRWQRPEPQVHARGKGSQHHHQRPLLHSIQRDRHLRHHDSSGWRRQDAHHDLYLGQGLHAPHEPSGTGYGRTVLT